MHLLQSLAFSGRLLSCILSLSIGLQSPVAIAAQTQAAHPHLVEKSTKRSSSSALQLAHHPTPQTVTALARGWHRVEPHAAGFEIMMPEQLRYVQERGHRATPSSSPNSSDAGYPQRTNQQPGNTNQPEQHFLSAADPRYGALYMVGWSKISPTVPTGPESLAHRWEEERNALLRSFDGELLHETNVQLPKHHHAHQWRKRRRRPRRDHRDNHGRSDHNRNDHSSSDHSQSSGGKHYLILGHLDGEALLITHRSYILGDRHYQVTVTLPQSHSPEARAMAEGFLQSFQLI